MWRSDVFAFINFLIILLLASPSPVASVNVDLRDDIYDVLSRLEAEGVIRGSLLSTRPLTRAEITRLILEAEDNAAGKGPLVRQLIEYAKAEFIRDADQTDYFKPVANVYGEYTHTDSTDAEKTTYNNDGYMFEKGSSFRAGMSSHAELGRLSLAVNPEIRSSGDNTRVAVPRAYGIFSYAGLDLELGKDSQWWGPGRHGALLLSDNPEPLTMLKVSNPGPVILPSVLRHLGLFKITFFVSRLEKDRVTPHPYLWGLRMNIKPNPYLEIGLQRTALLGGEGRPEDLKAWWKSLSGRGEDRADFEAGDQKGGMDITLTFPFARQPFQVYVEADGEDKAWLLPDKWAYLTGLYLPRLGSLERFEFRAEYAINHVVNHPDVWYNHHIYRSGYTYKGRIIGHHMGTDSRDTFIEMRYQFPGSPNGYASIARDWEEHNLSGRVRETEDETIIRIHLPVNSSTILNAEYRLGKLKNLDNIRGTERKIHIVTAAVAYEF